MSTGAVSGLAASIRNATESETFDLAGYTPTMVDHMVRDAFTQPFELTTMIRLTFITGAGKLGRAKYDDNAARALTNILRELQYEEDRGASAIIECAGSYKLQHDTGKNLKTVVVFPKVMITTTTAMNGLQQSIQNAKINGGNNHSHSNNNNNNNTSSKAPIIPLIEEGSTEQKLIQTPMNIFPKMMESKCETWQQKKACIQTMTKLKQMAETLDAKLIQGQLLSDTEQDYYNTVSITTLEEKITRVRDMMTVQVETGQLTMEEKKVLLEQITDRIQTLQQDMTDATESQAKAKRLEQLQLQLDQAKIRHTKIQSVTTILPPKLKNETTIIALRTEQVPLLELEKSAKGRLLTLKESQSLARKEEIETEIQALITSSRQWFEADAAFQSRIKVTQTNWEKQLKHINNTAKKKTTTNKATTSSSSSSGTKWVVPGAKKSTTTTATAWGSKPTSSKTTTKPTGSSGLFAAMMNDSSDSD